MKTLVYTIALFSILFIVSCSHQTVTPPITGAGSWVQDDTLHPVVSFKYDTFNSTSSRKYMDALDTTDFNEIRFVFSGSLPVTNGDIPIVSSSPTGNQVSIEVMNLAFFSGAATGGNSSQKVSVTIVNNKLRLTGSNIRIQEDYSGRYHTIQSFDLMQQ